VTIGFVPINVAAVPGSRVARVQAAQDPAAAEDEALMGVNATAGDAVQLRPVIQRQPGVPRSLWVFLHAALMMAGFALLLPLGLLLGRHRWMFGRDPRTVRWACWRGVARLRAGQVLQTALEGAVRRLRLHG
jgi:hypothetical protein